MADRAKKYVFVVEDSGYLIEVYATASAAAGKLRSYDPLIKGDIAELNNGTKTIRPNRVRSQHITARRLPIIR